ncbi:hypothetical protein [Actinomadura atramentaria]|uniref:hypothetical protein n=1 Tax=Actinomadura atramentaria TaxID=1990 RepID=UPI000362B9EA|nr:hypothetical protein [Actinomadura atramentaria]
MLYRLVMTVLVLLALTPALAAARMVTEGAPGWVTLTASVLVPAGTLVIGLGLARWHNTRRA